jgi:hypothetical protein
MLAGLESLTPRLPEGVTAADLKEPPLSCRRPEAVADHLNRGYAAYLAREEAWHRLGDIRQAVEQQLGGTVWSNIHSICESSPAQLAAFAPAVIDAWQAGDPVATGIVDKHTDRLAHLICCAMHKSPFATELVLGGSLLTSCDPFRDLLLRNKAERKTYVVTQPQKDAQEAVLDYARLAEADGLSKVRIVLRTGRTHQIRCQFSSRGLPLVGDKKYGGPELDGPIALWSHRLAFRHPYSGEPMEFIHEPPEIEPWAKFH